MELGSRESEWCTDLNTYREFGLGDVVVVQDHADGPGEELIFTGVLDFALEINIEIRL